jgi:hypothetical protein
MTDSDAEKLAPEFEGVENLRVLGQEKPEQLPLVFDITGQESDRFSHVASGYIDRCLTYEQALKKLEQQQSAIDDKKITLSDWEPVLNDDEVFALRHRDSGQDFVPTDHALRQLARIGYTGEGFLTDLRYPKTKTKKKGDPPSVLFEREKRDHELLREVIRSTTFHPTRVKQEKERFFRTWDNGTLRAVCGKDYAVIDNRWVIETLAELLPGGLVSHWRGDADTLACNILIPDTIRQENDSDYGGMLGCGNSEVGLRSYFTLPSVFRSVCSNGCMYGKEKGEIMRQRHYGKIDLAKVREATRINLEKQIPLLNEGIERMLGIRAFDCGDVPVKSVVAEVSREYGLTRKQAVGVLDHWHLEGIATQFEGINNAFGIQAAITRYGQTIVDRDGTPNNDAWIQFDRMGGDILMMDESRWTSVVERAGRLTSEQVEAAYLPTAAG